MLRRFSSCVIMLTLASMPARPQSPGTADARNQVEANYRRESAALAREDLAGVLVHYDKGYIYRGPKRRMYRAPQLQPVLARMFKNMDRIRSATRILRFDLRNQRANVRVSERIEGAILMDSGKRQTLLISEEREDIWKRLRGGWVKISGRSLKLRQTLDGKAASSISNPQPRR